MAGPWQAISPFSALLKCSRFLEDHDCIENNLHPNDLGPFFDNDVNRVEPVGENPFAPKVLPMSPVWTLSWLERETGIEPATSSLGKQT